MDVIIRRSAENSAGGTNTEKMVARAAAASVATVLMIDISSRSSSGQPPEISTTVLSPRTRPSAPRNCRSAEMLASELVCAARQADLGLQLDVARAGAHVEARSSEPMGARRHLPPPPPPLRLHRHRSCHRPSWCRSVRTSHRRYHRLPPGGRPGRAAGIGAVGATGDGLFGRRADARRRHPAAVALAQAAERELVPVGDVTGLASGCRTPTRTRTGRCRTPACSPSFTRSWAQVNDTAGPSGITINADRSENDSRDRNGLVAAPTRRALPGSSVF